MGRTRSGLEPKKSKFQKFEISTFQAKQYMQKKIDMIVEALRRQGDEDIQPMRIDLYSNFVSKRFVPFTILIEPTAAENFYEPKKDVEVEGEEIFETSDADMSGIAVLKKPFRDLLNEFAYTKDDIKDLRNEAYKKKMNIANMGIDSISRYSKPRFYQVDGDGYVFTRIVMFIDPLKLFHDMLTEGTNKNFNCLVSVNQKVNDSEYKYEVVKQPYKKGRRTNVDKMIQESLASRMRGLGSKN